uniref:Glycosyltransferase family 92 protein n=1 Tax=Panagrolaimus sp. ES5 TaxID=591445 RepID=A0AC34FK16_9BILA
MYVRSAFRVSDTEIRLSVVKSHLNMLPLNFHYGSKRGQVTLICHLPKCPDTFSPPCDLNGYIGIIKNLSLSDADNHLFLYSTISNLTSRITIVDVRPKTEGFLNPSPYYPHQLGVCLQPIYLMTDYTLFIQFFEYWLNVGATKFYIYWESYSEEVRDILDFYIQTSGVDIELINWSRLPTTIEGANDLKLNPNAYWFRLEVFLGIFDCMHRARHNVKFVSQSDLDEMFYVKNQTLLQFLEDMNKMHPKMVDIQFLSKRVHMNDFHVHIHRPQTPEEIIPGSGKYYEHINVGASQAVVWHFRRLKDHYKVYRVEHTTSLSHSVEMWKENFQNRIRTGKLADRQEWKNRGASFGQELDKCRQNQSDNRHEVCHNLLACELQIKSVQPNEWIRASNSWHLV